MQNSKFQGGLHDWYDEFLQPNARLLLIPSIAQAVWEAVAFGHNWHNRCEVPELPPGTRYVAAAAGGAHSVLIRDDGEAVAVGRNWASPPWRGRCEAPPASQKN